MLVHLKQQFGLTRMKLNKEQYERHLKAKKRYYKKHKKRLDATRKEKRDSGYYTVYYLPNEHYCGVTSMSPEFRMAFHKHKGKNTNDWRVLYCSIDKKEAYYHESLFHGVLGMEGLIINNKVA